MAKQYLHIAFHSVGQPLIKELEPVFGNLAEDWIRYSGNCWIVWTSNDPNAWHAALKPHMRPDDQFLILGLKNGIAVGWLPQWIWDWINKPRI